MKITNLILSLACAASLAAAMGGCARTRMLKGTIPQASTAPIIVSDGALKLALEHVIVRNGPGS